MSLKKHLELLGMNAVDKVTGKQGVITSISFDLYGCIQAVLTPKINKDGKTQFESCWLDVTRLKIIGKKPVMNAPAFDADKGAAEKPAF